MKKPMIIIGLILLVILGTYYFSSSSSTYDQRYNWSLELTKPLDYKMELKNISYYKADKEIFRHTTMNSFSGWSGSAAGSVLHNKIKEYLPDSVKLSWEETETAITYTAAFVFPKQQIIDYWNENYELLQQKWGADYPKGQLSLKLGIAADGMMTLWFSDMDINTSGFALEVASYKATDISKEQQTDINPSTAVPNIRFGTPHFYTFEGENVVAISILYHNGESNTMSLKRKNGSLLENINANRGWGLVKKMTVHWFDKDGKGYKSTYEVGLNELPKNRLGKSLETQIIYLLDRSNAPDEEWNTWTDTHIFELTETERKTIH
ncbi:MAG: hypothetical protein ACI9Y7_002386 [Dokdonia sp.]|jgi:hypothetical protein